jgi:hypothetical protein
LNVCKLRPCNMYIQTGQDVYKLRPCNMYIQTGMDVYKLVLSVDMN